MILNIINFAQKKPLYFTLIIFSILIIIEVILLTTPIITNVKYPVIVDVSEKSNLNDLSNILYKKKIIKSKINFKIASRLFGLETKIKPGRYHVTENHSYVGLVLLFLNTEPESPITFRILKGSTLKKTIENLSLSFGYNSSDISKLLNNKVLMQKFGFVSTNAEGYIIPKRYTFYKSDGLNFIIQTLLKNTKSFFYDTLKINNPEKIHEILTLASIVEGETNKIEEYPIIAGVYLNRLKIGMPLQACPTVQYALGRDKWDKITYKNLSVESPYNTYKYKGLPPGPIGNPSKEAIFAVVYPAYHNYLFFVADGKGGHKFSERYNQHLTYKSELKQ
ncbi:MAG TPA: endolytic transglycosylase MltG [Ignavibacteriales bacterium]|nr:endolytic transglycosylase MltG [Ignavibacteriales bacterium]HOL80637.1 endolytic transglycosylase MltG [Ignavibacteriales bacterium]HOM64325.1 endolytic transglycosylase MltG [Ignavibacteriales bacterium]HPD68015.1 endolytic transglycosylase MltG [Ignavibacteriales bacterium]HPP33029.1 endolytic transglycosylase MltG [Ignavibacteriales bacterium]